MLVRMPRCSTNSSNLNLVFKGKPLNPFGCDWHLLRSHSFVVSDWGAQHSGVSSALAGLDQTMPGDEAFDSGNAYWVRDIQTTWLSSVDMNREPTSLSRC